MTDVTPTTTVRCDWITPPDMEGVDGQCIATATWNRRFPSGQDYADFRETWLVDADGKHHYCPEHKAIARANLSR